MKEQRLLNGPSTGSRCVQLALWLVCALSCPVVQADNTDPHALPALSLEALMNIEIHVGARGSGHAAHRSPVPLDIISADELRLTGYGELGKALQSLLPSFNFPRSAVADGTDHARPFTLRGMGADQVLVLINGKRRHPGALLHLNATIGRGSSGVDLNMIPLHAIERVEVLRDGAAAQYGSDAIAGIINIVLAKQSGTEFDLTAGQTSEGDGELLQLALAHGGELGDGGFYRFDIELRDRGDTNRSGRDRRQQYFSGDPRNALASRVTHQIGDADLKDLLLTAQAESPAIQGIHYYMNVILGQREGDSTGYFRRPLDDRNVRAIYPDGFLPHIVSDIEDLGLTAGAEGQAAGWDWDLSYTLGMNEFDFGVENSLNTSLGVASQTEFDSGRLRFMQHLLNLDMVKALDVGLSNPLQTAVGLEMRKERFEIDAGEPASYIHGGIAVLDGPNAGNPTPAGAQVFPGFKPENETDAERDNFGSYLDLEYRFNPRWLLQAAARYERYCDFGDTLNGKLAGVFTPNQRLSLRASASSGFRAPSLAQSDFTSTATVFFGSTPVEIGTYNVDHPLARALGATDLEPEESRHLNAGFSYRASERLMLSADIFRTRVDDRIVLSGDIYQNPAVYGAAAVSVLQAYGVGGARYFSNAIDTETTGIDASVKYEWELEVGSLDLAARYHANRTRIIGSVRAPAILGGNGPAIVLNRAEREQRIENGQPEDVISLSARYRYRNWDLALRLQRFGEYEVINYLDDPAYDQTIPAAWVTDVQAAWQPADALEVAFGVHNLFDVYPEANQRRVGDAFNGADGIIPYAPNAPFGYNGAFYYMRLSYRF